MSATHTPEHVTEAYTKAGGVDRYVSIFGGRHFDDPVQETGDSSSLYRAEVKTPKAETSSEQKTLVEWLERQTWSDFAQSLAEFYSKRGYLTEKQEDAALRMKGKVEARENERAQQAHNIEGLDLSELPAGLYAVPGGETRLKVTVDKVESGKWAGFTFVHDGAEYGQRQKYGMQAPDRTYNGGIQDQLRAIMNDPQAARERYAEITGRCYACNRKLEDETSVRLGIGPICRSQ